MFNILAADCSSINETFGWLIRAIILIIQIAVPILMIVMGMLDLGKAVTSQKEDEIKKAQSILIKRLIYGVLVFLVVAIVKFVLGLVSGNDGGGVDNAIDCVKILING